MKVAIKLHQENYLSEDKITFMTANNVTTIIPFLTVNDAAGAISFYVSALGATEGERYETEGGKLTAKLLIEGSAFYVGSEEPEFGNVSPDSNSNSPVRIILTTKHADVLFERAVKAGAIQICPMTTEDTWRIGKLKDPFGHTWEIGYVLSE